VPVLARVIEAAGISTVLVTMMPFWSEKMGVPRTLAVEFPFGHALGHAGDRDEQLAVIREALRVLREAREPGTVHHMEREWPDFEKWKTAWYPPALPPIIKVLAERLRQQRHEERVERD
jgi:acetylornithine deacetylase/succinyl-diaminopimelate desuccinylase-like protein